MASTFSQSFSKARRASLPALPDSGATPSAGVPAAPSDNIPTVTVRPDRPPAPAGSDTPFDVMGILQQGAAGKFKGIPGGDTTEATPSAASRGTPTAAAPPKAEALPMAGPATTPGPPSPSAGVLAGFADTATQGTPPVSAKFGQEALRSATLGASELAIPGVEALIPGNRQPGEGFLDAASRMRAARAAKLKEWAEADPGQAAVADVAGSLASAPALGPLFGVAGEGAGLGARALNYGRNIATGGALGAAQGAMENPDQPLQGAETGGLTGAGGMAVAPAVGALASGVKGVVKGAPGAVAPFVSKAGQEAKAASAVAKNAADIPSLQNKDNLIPGGMGGIQEALGGSEGLAPGAAQPGAVHQASDALQEGLQNARSMAQTEETRLWAKPTISDTQVNLDPTKNAFVAKQQALLASGPVSMQDLPTSLQKLPEMIANLPQTTTVRDLNMIRSDLLSTARSANDPNAARVARQYADTILDSMDQMPELRSNPQIQKDYQDARDFSRQYRTAFAQPGIAGAIAPKTDSSLAGGRVFNLNRGTSRGDEWANVRQVLQGAGQNDLSSGLRDQAKQFIVSDILNRSGAVLGGQSPSGTTMSKLIANNRDAFQRAGVFTGKEMEILNKVSQTLEGMQGLQAAAPKSMKDARIINPVLEHFSRVAGLIGGAHSGGLLHMAAGAIGGHAVASVMENAQNAVNDLVKTAMSDPHVAAGLMMRVNTPANRLTPETRALLQRVTSLLGTEGAVSGANAVSGTTSTPTSQPTQ
jgi:hypothetical protein